MSEYSIVHYSSEVREIGVISDTHIPTRGRYLPPEIFRYFKGVQLILHAGDLVDEKVIDELGALAPVEAVAGNMDPPGLQIRLGRLKLVRVGNISIGLLHGDIGGRRLKFNQAESLFNPEQLQAVVFGHLHEPVVKKLAGILYFNPGSATDPRRVPQPSCGRLLIEGSEISGEILMI